MLYLAVAYTCRTWQDYVFADFVVQHGPGKCRLPGGVMFPRVHAGKEDKLG